jgi:hypothetical protein
MTVFDEVHVILKDIFGSPHLRFLALHFERIAVEQASSQVQTRFQ